MAQGQSKLTVEVEVKNARDGAEELRNVDRAQKQAADNAEAAAKKYQAGAASWRTAGAAAEDYTATLNRMNPMLGATFDVMRRSLRIMNDLGGQSVALKSAFERLATATRNNFQALKLIAASGAVTAGIMLVVRAVNAMKEAFDKVSESIRAQNAALTESTRKQREATAAYLDDAAARKQRSGDTVDQLDKERSYVDRLIERYQLSGERAEKARTTGRAIAGLPLTDEERKAAILGAAGREKALEIGPGVPEATAVARARRFAADRQTREAVERIEQQAREERERIRERASHELHAGGGGTANLQAFLRHEQGMGEEEAARVAEQMQRIGATSPRGLEQARERHLRDLSGGAQTYVSEHERTWYGAQERIAVQPYEAAAMQAALHALTREVQHMRADGERGGVVIQNSRVYLPGSGYDRNSVVNGETMVRRTERQTNPW